MSALLPPTHTRRVAALGCPKFFPSPTPSNPEAVRLDSDWVRDHLVEVIVPQLQHFGVRHSITCHYKAAKPLVALWQAWDDAGLLELVHTYDGCWVARFVRQNGTYAERVEKCRTLGAEHLSNHAFGSAFDINVSELPLGHPCPADAAFRQLIPIANDLGWFWGNEFHSRPDPQHFELAV